MATRDHRISQALLLIITVSIMNVELLTLKDAENITDQQAYGLFCEYINPNLGKMMNMLGFCSSHPVRADNCYITFSNGKTVIDFTAQFGIMNIGHNHPRILKARQDWANRKELELWKFFPSPYQGILAKNLASILPGDLDVTFFCNSGAEANEGALKLASKVAGSDRDVIVHSDISFHGKTHATLSISGSEMGQNSYFKLLSGCESVRFGDLNQVENIFNNYKTRFSKTKVSTLILEAVRAEGVHISPPDYLKGVRKLCDDFKVTLIMDEVFTGFGRTGKAFAFNHFDITPDIVTYSKAFGGGKASFGAYTARRSLYKKAYGTMKDATLHSTTYNGFGEEVVSAIEAINILYEEDLFTNAQQKGDYLNTKLNELKDKHSVIKSVNCIGLLCCVKIENVAAKLARFLPGDSSNVVAKLTTGGIIAKLFEDYDILIYTPPHDFDLLFITPPLTITEEQIDKLIYALNEVLKLNLVELAQVFLKRFINS